MYQNIYVNRKDDIVHLWDDEKGYRTFPYERYAYKRHAGGNFKSIYGDELVRVTNYNEKDPNLFESDISPEMKVLLDYYPDSDEPSKGHNIGVIDIEVSTEGGFPKMDLADKEITGISLYDSLTRTCYVFVLDRDGKVSNNEEEVPAWLPVGWKTASDEESKPVKISTKSYDDEDELLIGFMDKWQECNFTIITGWNVNDFDMPYLYTRIRGCLGARAAKCLSPIGTTYINGFTKQLTIAGISVMDYILLYKKFLAGKTEPSFKLGEIGKKLVGMDKIQYRGNLNDLYKQDIKKFLEYNITDVKIVVAIDVKLKLIDLYRNICHVGHVPYEDFHMPARYLDGASLMYLRRNGGLIAPNKPANGREEYEERDEEDEEGFSGAFVKEPVPGRYNWVFDLDLTSMYPNIIISLNISPETKIGKVIGADYTDKSKVEKRRSILKEIEAMDKKVKEKLWYDEDGKEEYIRKRCNEFDMEYHVREQLEQYRLGVTNYTKDEFRELLSKSNYSISSNGVLYRTDKPGVVPTLLTLWFSQRKEMRKKAAEYKKAGNTELYNFYNQRQQVQKILLNSFYGVLGLPIFRFYDVDNAEAVTMSGVDIIQTTSKAINIYYKEALEVEEGDWVIYSDTDSCFVDAVPIIKKRFPTVDFNNDDEMTKAIMSVTTEVQEYVNTFYNIMARKFFNIEQHTFDAKQEVISKTSFWLAKKRYAQWIIHKEGSLLAKPELEVKGIDVVRTSFPSAFRKFMDLFLRKLLTATPKAEIDDMILKMREDVKILPVVEIAKNTSVKFVSRDGTKNYNPENRRPLHFEDGAPAQVKAALAYNDLINQFKISTICEPIHHGSKIKWVYLQRNGFGLESIALKADDTDADELLKFIDEFVDRKKMFEKELKSKLEDFYDVLRWSFPNPSVKTAANFFDFGG
jgi:DNA polymerase elongation subunit (family B)